MMSSFTAWRRTLWLWLLPLAFCLVNLLGFAVYRTTFAGKVERLERQAKRASDQLAQIEKERQFIEDFLQRVEDRKDQVRTLYHGHFPTQQKRFTQVIQEVKDLIAQAGLRPDSLSYPSKVFEDHRLVQRSIKFRVDGTYDELRRFINFLELSDLFLTLRSVSLTESGTGANPKLGINLVLSTIFSTREPQPPIATELAVDNEPAAALEEPST